MTGPQEALPELLAAAWQRQRPRFLKRLEEVVDALEALASGEPVPGGAVDSAHVLAGALGTYGRQGSPLLREVELLLAGGTGDAGGLAARVRVLCHDLD